MAADWNTVEEVSLLLKGRISELDEERKRLERAMARLDQAGKRRRDRPGARGVSATTARAASPGQRRKRRGGTRAEQALALIENGPGLRAPEVAKAMKIQTSYVYSVLGKLVKERRVQKDGRRYLPAS